MAIILNLIGTIVVGIVAWKLVDKNHPYLAIILMLAALKFIF